MRLSPAIVGIVGLAAAGTANAGIALPFLEDFESGPAEWRDADNTLLNWFPTGGADGGAYASSDFNFLATAGAPFPPTVFRAQDEFNSSNNAFVGNWIAEGVAVVEFEFRHNAP
ncbi:MAG: hypothetical protein AAFX05_15095, partial [Planctomycetota bacterium]